MRYIVGFFLLFTIFTTSFVKPVIAIEAGALDPGFINGVYAGANGNVNSIDIQDFHL
jgi:hypothetical protein